MKLILKFFIVLLLLGCSSNDDNTDVITPEEETTNTYGGVALENYFSLPNISSSNAREAIVFENELYVITETETYKSGELINTDCTGVANYPYLDYNVSFIRNNKWHIINQNALWVFDFSTNIWDKIKEFDNNLLAATIGVYADDSLYVFSDISDKVYKYDFENNSLIEHASFEQRPNYGQFVKSAFEINGVYYYTKLTDYDTVSIYKWTNNFTTFEFLNEYQSEYLAQGIAFVYWDTIIFGLGGEVSSDANGNVSSSQLNDELYYYTVSENQFFKVRNNFYEGRYLSLPVKYGAHDVYLLGGQTVENNEIVNKQTLDYLHFSYVLP